MGSNSGSQVPTAVVAELFRRVFGRSAARVDRSTTPLRSLKGAQRALIWRAPDADTAIAQVVGVGDDEVPETHLVASWAGLGSGHGGIEARSSVLDDALRSVSEGECLIARSGAAVLAVWARRSWWASLLPPAPQAGLRGELRVVVPTPVRSGILCPSHDGTLNAIFVGSTSVWAGVLTPGTPPQFLPTDLISPDSAPYAAFDAELGGSDVTGSHYVTVAAKGRVEGGGAPVAVAEWVASGSRVGIRINAGAFADAATSVAALVAPGALMPVPDPPVDASQSGDDMATQRLSTDAIALLLGRAGH